MRRFMENVNTRESQESNGERLQPSCTSAQHVRMPRARISAFLVLFTARVPYATSHTHDDEFFFHFQFMNLIYRRLLLS